MFRYLLATLIVVHGLIHIAGFTNAFGIATNAGIGQVSKPEGATWLAAALLFMVNGIAVFASRNWWPMGLAAVAMSQILVIGAWKSAGWGTAPNVIVLFAAFVNLAAWQFREKAYEQAEALGAAASSAEVVVTTEQLRDLPEPVRRWLEHSGVVGRNMIHTVRLKQKGRLRMGEAKRWMTMTADQYFNTDTPSFLWFAHINYGITHIAGCDVLSGGKGNMQIKIASMVTVADAKGAQTDQGTMLRYLAEMQWFPTAALSPYISWRAMDATAAEAEMNYGGMRVKGIFHFNVAGDITAFEARRFMEQKGNYSLETWYVPVTEYRVFDGIRVPSKGEAIWKLKAGDFNWFDWEIKDIKYNNTGPLRN